VRDRALLPRLAIRIRSALRQIEADARADAVVLPPGRGEESDVDLRLPSTAVLERIDMAGVARIETVTSKQAASTTFAAKGRSLVAINSDSMRGPRASAAAAGDRCANPVNSARPKPPAAARSVVARRGDVDVDRVRVAAFDPCDP
jgi:hypothetical protein